MHKSINYREQIQTCNNQIGNLQVLQILHLKIEKGYHKWEIKEECINHSTQCHHMFNSPIFFILYIYVIDPIANIQISQYKECYFKRSPSIFKGTIQIRQFIKPFIIQKINDPNANNLKIPLKFQDDTDLNPKLLIQVKIIIQQKIQNNKLKANMWE
ncbi:unnamed protein product [Paramecium sonneborni]|uniref:Uncharacterized protein n=1 Tax=Paramecium sonneborni TaxID=65129 RepID=A0A8S1PUP7_9CILI|nr:unnamed protein product [Paramecium sonneborni]